MTRTEIADAINSYKRAKQESKDRYSDMIRIAVELGMNQHDAIKSSVVDFLDGYLVASGMAPKSRESV